MASNSYYGNDNNNNMYQQQQPAQVGYGQPQDQSYGATYGQQQQYQSSNEQNFQSDGTGGYGQSSNMQGQTYADGSREQKYDAQGNPVLPNGERGILGDLAGAAAGGFLGHKVGGHGFLGAIAGGIGAHFLGDAMKPKPSGYGRPSQGGGMFGRRDLDDGSADSSIQQQQPGYGQVEYGQQQQQGQYDSQNYGQQQQGQYEGQSYGRNYGQ